MSAAWKTTMASGVSTGALVRMGRSAGPRRTYERTKEPFFSDPYEEKCAPFNPIRSTAALASTCPAAWEPNPPIDSSRISKNRPEVGNDTAWFTACTRYLRRLRRGDRNLHGDARPLQLCVHESLQFGDVGIRQMREARLQLQVLANRFVLFGFELVSVLAIFPFVHVPHAGFDGEPSDLDRLGFVELPSLWTGGVDVEECRPLHVQGLPHFVYQVDRISHRGRGDILHRRMAADDELRRILG